MSKPKVIAIVGPTASGKTSLSVTLAKELNGEVISADSRQVYHGLDIGSGKVTPEEMDGVPHHLLDIVDPMTVYTASDFTRDAAAAIDDIVNRGCCPIIAGGTFFYIELLRGTMQAAPVEPNPELRASLEQKPDQELYEIIAKNDPEFASKIDKNNRRRLIRAVEIIDALSSIPRSTPQESDYEWLVLGVDIERDVLHENIKTRLHERIDTGMIEEVHQLLEHGVTHARLEELGLEYRYVSRFLRNELSKEEMVEQLETKIRQFAKRQLTWLKRDESIEWYAPQNFKEILRRSHAFLAE